MAKLIQIRFDDETDIMNNDGDFNYFNFEFGFINRVTTPWHDKVSTIQLGEVSEEIKNTMIDLINTGKFDDDFNDREDMINEMEGERLEVAVYKHEYVRLGDI